MALSWVPERGLGGKKGRGKDTWGAEWKNVMPEPEAAIDLVLVQKKWKHRVPLFLDDN